MTFDEWCEQLDIDPRCKTKTATLSLTWSASASVEREKCARLVADLVMRRVPASEYADKIRARIDTVNYPTQAVKVLNEGYSVIVVDDHCYAIRNLVDGEWRFSAWVFPEALQALKELPENPEDAVRIWPILNGGTPKGENNDAKVVDET